tara:strand:- start:153 stop:830 length:678 start_codon:yes stop_codon:yes gene_type:complete
MNDGERFARAMNVLAAAFDKEIDEATLEAYWMALEDMDIEGIERACKHAIQNLEFFPRPAHLRRSQDTMDPSSRAIIAWQAVVRAIATVGQYASVDFDDKLTNATVRNLGGWYWLCQQPEKEVKVWVRKGFEKIYIALAGAGVTSESTQHLPGIHERDNLDVVPEVRSIFTGLPGTKVKLLGDGGVSNQTHHTGQASLSEERQADSSFGKQDVHRFIKESFVMEE